MGRTYQVQLRDRPSSPLVCECKALSTRIELALSLDLGFLRKAWQVSGALGGLGALQSKINYPEIAKKAGVEGTVFLQFVVDENGNVVDPQVVKGIGAGCDEEALRAVRQVKFKPGMQRGRPVKVRFQLPVRFRLK